MDWPARSPDLNPIENVWGFLGRRLDSSNLPPVTIRELRLALQDEWAAMPQQLIDTLILSMDSAPNMMGKKNGCLKLMKDSNPEMILVHCVIHRQNLVAKNISSVLNKVLHTIIKCVNVIKASAKCERLFKLFCEEQNEDHVRLLLHIEELWFQQDTATCHTARATINLLKDTFGDRLISRFGPVNWPPRSCDLTPLDYFLWGYVKSLVYADKPQTLDYLKTTFAVLLSMYGHKCWKDIENWTSRFDYIRASRGSHMLEIIFKM
ncbi:SCAN domain-containing protein 3 [Trichonephila clavipes]|nr:SCAN domain-containing protein 3 [Trichonephila clavipes]